MATNIGIYSHSTGFLPFKFVMALKSRYVNFYVLYWYLIPHYQLVLNHQLQVACICGIRTLCMLLPANMHCTMQRGRINPSHLGRSNLLSLTIFLQSVSCRKSTAVTPNSGGALRSGTVGLRTGHWSRRMSHTGLCISPLQRSQRRPRLGIFLCVVKAQWKVHWESQHVCFSLATLLTSSDISDTPLLG